MDSWDVYRSTVPDRLLLRLDSYVFQLDFVAVNFSRDQQLALWQQLRAGVVEAIKTQPGFSLAAVTFPKIDEDENVFFRINYGSPVYSFAVEMSNSALRFFRTGLSVEDYVLLCPLLQEVARQVLGSNSLYSLAAHDFFRQTYRTSHTLSQDLSVGFQITDETITKTNREVIEQFADFSEHSLLRDLQPDRVLRTDVEYSAEKEIGGRNAVFWITARAPYSPTQRDLSFTFSLRRGEDPSGTPGLVESDFFEFSAVAEKFYRDIIIDRVYRRLFNDITVSAT